ncbi:hypothetical protein ACE6H2_001485 [Prunus campanulata]
MSRGTETSKGACIDSGYLGGCERLSHRAPSIESGHLSIKHPDSQNSDYNSVDINVPRREDIIGKEFKTIEIGIKILYKLCKSLKNEKFNEVPYRIQPPMLITRENCPTLFLIGYGKKCNIYVMTNFEPHYNHELVTPLQSPYLQCNYVIRNSDLA